MQKSLCRYERVGQVGNDDADLRSKKAQLGQMQATLEKKTIQQAIAKHEGNLSKAAQELGLGRTTLYRKMAKHGL